MIPHESAKDAAEPKPSMVSVAGEPGVTEVVVDVVDSVFGHLDVGNKLPHLPPSRLGATA